MTFEEVKQFIEGNKENQEVQSYLQGLNPMSVEGMERFVNENGDGKRWLDSLKDKHLNKGLETWKANNLEKVVDEEIKKRFPAKDDKEIEVEKLRAEVEKMKQEKLRESLTNKAIKIADDKKLPLSLVDFFIGADEGATLNNLKVLEDTYNSSVQKAVEQRLKGEGYNPPKDSNGNNLTLEAIQKMSQAEINQNWDQVRKILKNK